MLTYSASGVPRGASFDASTAILSFRPSEQDVGDHVVRVTASDGSLSTTQEFVIHVALASREQHELEEWQSYLLPGAGYALYVPRARQELGAFSGVELELLLGAWIHHNDNRGPSHGRIYLNAELLSSTHADMPILFGYSLGFSLSLERNPNRAWLIPVYGLDIGGIVQDKIGSPFQSTPYLGMHVYSSPNVFISARGGYRLVPRDLERLGGWHVGLSGDFSVW